MARKIIADAWSPKGERGIVFFSKEDLQQGRSQKILILLGDM
jgi:hypothetical protein